MKWLGDEDSIDDLVKRAQKLLKEKGASESESKALVLRRGGPPARDPGGKDVRRLSIPPLPAVRKGGIYLVPMPAPCHAEVYTPPRQDVISPWAGTGAPLQPPEWIQLPRYCVQYDEPWLAQYGLLNDEFQYLSSVEFPKHLQSRYSAANEFAIPSGFHTQREQCAICLTWTPNWATGAVWCEDGCGRRVCYGRTSQDRFFVCRDGCGNRGLLIPSRGDKSCLVPGGGSGRSTR
jgi:hypothetical protein